MGVSRRTVCGVGLMEDKELLELAAKAAGAKWDKWCSLWTLDEEEWNPLTDDGDALRLAVKLEMNLFHGYLKIVADLPSDGDMPSVQGSALKGDDPYAATRRAIVCAAAEIGRTM